MYACIIIVIMHIVIFFFSWAITSTGCHLLSNKQENCDRLDKLLKILQWYQCIITYAESIDPIEISINLYTVKEFQITKSITCMQAVSSLVSLSYQHTGWS